MTARLLAAVRPRSHGPDLVEQYRTATAASASAPRTVLPSLAAARPAPRLTARRTAGTIALWAAFWITLAAVVQSSLPVLGRSSLSLTNLAFSTAAALPIGTLACRRLATLGRRSRVLVPTVAAVVFACYLWGALTTPLAAGRPVLATSRAAHAHDEITAMRSALEDLVRAEDLLALDEVDARARYGEFTTLAKRMSAVAARYARPDGWASSTLSQAATQIAHAAHAAQAALEESQVLLVEPDPARARKVADATSALGQGRHSAETTLEMAAEEFGF